MNLLEIPNCPISETDLESLLRLMFEGQRLRVGISVSYNPHFEYESQWEVTVFFLLRPLWVGGKTLEEAIERAFEAIREYQKTGD